MPKPTFLNLPAEKRQRILDVAVNEFAEKGYAAASISAMVAAAGIAKGSFYQYFADKEDLFLYLYDTRIANTKSQVFEQEAHRLKDLSITGFLRVVFARILELFSQNPQLVKIATGLLRDPGQPIYKVVAERYEGVTQGYLLPYIAIEVERGELDAAVNTRLLNFMLLSVGQYLLSRIQREGAALLNAAVLDTLVDDLEYILTNGIYKGANNPHP